MRALSNEIAKNLVLAGIGSLTVQDDQSVGDDDLGAQFFISEEEIGKNVSCPLLRISHTTHQDVASGSSSSSDTQTEPASDRQCRIPEHPKQRCGFL